MRPLRPEAIWLPSLLLLILISGSLAVRAAPTHAPAPLDIAATFATQVAELSERSFKRKQAAVAALAALDHPQVLPLLEALLNGDLHYRRSDRALIRFDTTTTPPQALQLPAATPLAAAEVGDLKRVIINNAMRSQLRDAIAERQLAAADPARRLAAVNQLINGLDADQIALLQRHLPTESDSAVREQITLALAIGQLRSAELPQQLAAIAQLDGSLNPAALAALQQILQQHSEPALIDAATRALANSERQRSLYQFAETLFFGLSLGSVLVLAAIGLAITFGVMGVINMAHGELMMLGAYTTWLIQTLWPDLINYSLLLAVPAAFLVSGIVGIAIERGIIRSLYGRPLETLLATFGVSLILQQLVRTLVSPQNVPVANPDWMSGAWEINTALALTWNRLYIILFTLLLFALLLWILKRTRLGLQVRAVAQNRAMARAMGVRAGWVDALTFGLGSGIAGVAGVALSQLTNVGPNLGQSYIIDSFMVVVFGGVGNLWGTLVAGLGLGVINKLLEPWAGAVLAKIVVLIGIILFIQKRPRGLFPQQGRGVDG